jgi:phosphatidylserine synthase
MYEIEGAEAPSTVAVDARNRAARTFFQGLAIDVVAAVVVVLLPAVSNVEWTPAYWGALGLIVAKTCLTALISYVARHVAPPATAATEGASVASVASVASDESAASDE